MTASGCGGDTSPADLTLPGATFYPESLSAAADGTIYVGSFGTGQVVRFAPGQDSAEVFLAGDPEVKQVLGLMVDDSTASLLLCSDDTSADHPILPSLRRYDRATGALRSAHTFPTAAFCNDLALDPLHNVYVSDSLGSVYRLEAGGSELALWSSDPLLAPSSPGEFGANGIAYGAGNVYVTVFSENRVVRIPVKADGTADAAVALEISPALNGPDALRIRPGGDLLVVEQSAGRLTTVSLPDGHATVIAGGFDSPTSVVEARGSYLVTEGQLAHLFGTVSTPPALPFKVRRIPAGR